MFAVGLVAAVLSFICLRMGYGSLRDGQNHLEYGVETEALHRTFARSFIVVGWILGASGGFMILAGIFG